MMNNALRRNTAKNDKRKTAKAVTPLRSMEILFLLCRNLQAIKILPNLKQVWRVFVKSFGHSNTAHQIAVFFNLVDVSTYGSVKRKADKL